MIPTWIIYGLANCAIPSCIAEQTHETIIHVLLQMAVKKIYAGIVSHKVYLIHLISAISIPRPNLWLSC